MREIILPDVPGTLHNLIKVIGPANPFGVLYPKSNMTKMSSHVAGCYAGNV